MYASLSKLAITIGQSMFVRRSSQRSKQQLSRLRPEMLEERRLLAVTIEPLGTYATNIFDAGAAEIVTYDKTTERLYVINSPEQAVDILDLSDPTLPQKVGSLDLSAYGIRPTSVTVDHGLVAVAVLGDKETDRGHAVFFDSNGTELGAVRVGAFPDMLAFTPDGEKVLVANEGQPNDDYTVDPEGSVTIIDITELREQGIRGQGQHLVTTAKFNKFNDDVESLRQDGIHLPGFKTTVAKNLEPEYLTISSDSKTAWITLQENNAIAELDIDSGEIVSIAGLGFKDHSSPGNGLDASDRDGGVNIQNWRIKGMFQPDGITNYTAPSNGETYLVTANEGDARDYDGFSEEVRVADLILGPSFGTPEEIADLQDRANLGRLRVTSDPPTGVETNDMGERVYNELYAFGSRSFTIWSSAGELVFDSGDDFEQITSMVLPPQAFNSTNDDNDSFDSRSDDKGPEPEAVVVGEVDDRIYAFVGLERIGGVMIYDITDPTQVEFSDYVNYRDYAGDPAAGTALDLGVEGLKFISATDSPTGIPLLVAANEISGTTTVFSVVSKPSVPIVAAAALPTATFRVASEASALSVSSGELPAYGPIQPVVVSAIRHAGFAVSAMARDNYVLSARQQPRANQQQLSSHIADDFFAKLAIKGV
jgi:hypothetical protein